MPYGHSHRSLTDTIAPSKYRQSARASPIPLFPLANRSVADISLANVQTILAQELRDSPSFSRELPTTANHRRATDFTRCLADTFRCPADEVPIDYGPFFDALRTFHFSGPPENPLYKAIATNWPANDR